MGQTKEAAAKKLAEEQKKKKKMITAIIILLVIVIAIVVFLLMNRPRDVVTPQNVDQVVQDMVDTELVEPGYYLTKMNTHWHFANGSAVSKDAWVENDMTNTNDVYFDVYLAEDESEPIYESPVLAVGSRLDSIQLDTPLPKGKYDCVAVYNLVDENQKEISSLRVGFKITVKK